MSFKCISRNLELGSFEKFVAVIALVFGVSVNAHAQTIDCDVPAPTTPGVITTGRPYTVAFCVPSTVTITNPDSTTDVVPNRVDGYQGVLDSGTPIELGKLALGTPSPTLKLQAASYRASSGVPKGNHTWTITPWNCPIGIDGVTPDCTKPKQMGSPVSIPFVASDAVQTGAPPAIQKGRVIR